MRKPTFLAALTITALWTASGRAGPADAALRVERISGEPLAADRISGIADGALLLASGKGDTKVPLADVIEVAFATPPDAPRVYADTEVAADLASGEVVRGEITGGDEHGFTLTSRLLGPVKVSLDHLVSLRFLQRLARMPEAPDLHAADATDVLHLAGGDRMACTVESFGRSSMKVESSAHESQEVVYERIAAVRIFGETAHRAAGTLLVAVLRDGSQIVGSAPAVADGHLSLKSVSGFDASPSLDDIVAVHVLSDRLAYLSDVAPATTEIQPFWKPVAGDPAVLYAPRADKSFGGGSLRCGGRSWVKGLGVYSGTTMTWKLDGAFKEFRAAAGVDDAAGPLGGVVFEVLVDGKPRWSSGFVRAAGTEGRGAAGPVVVPRVDVTGAKTLTLRVLSGDKDDPWPVADQADWLGAMLVK